MNGRENLFKFYWTADTVVMEQEFFVGSLLDDLFLYTLRMFAGAADHFDTVFNERFGGKLAEDDQRAAFDA